jgi:hypothetical protein
VVGVSHSVGGGGAGEVVMGSKWSGEVCDYKIFVITPNMF